MLIGNRPWADVRATLFVFGQHRHVRLPLTLVGSTRTRARRINDHDQGTNICVCRNNRRKYYFELLCVLTLSSLGASLHLFFGVLCRRTTRGHGVTTDRKKVAVFLFFSTLLRRCLPQFRREKKGISVPFSCSLFNSVHCSRNIRFPPSYVHTSKYNKDVDWHLE